MQNAVFKTFPDAHSDYKFTNRAPEMLFSRRCYDWVKQQVQGERLHIDQHWILIASVALSQLRLSPAERRYLEEHCPYFHADYLDFVENLQLDPANQVKVTFVPRGDDAPAIAENNNDGGDSAERGAKRRKVHDADQSADQMGLIEMNIQGPWRDCILYEVPLMSICECLSDAHDVILTFVVVSEGYFKFDDTDWEEDYQAVQGKSACLD